MITEKKSGVLGVVDERSAKKKKIGIIIWDVDPEFRRKFKVSATLQGESMKSALIRMIQRYIKEGPEVPALRKLSD